MKIGSIGAGYIARAVGIKALACGHEVMLSNSRDPRTLFSLRGIVGCEVGSPTEAAEFGDVVLVAVPLFAHELLPVDALRAKVVLDATNYYPERDGQIDVLDRGELSTSELVGRHLPESSVVRVFNAIQSRSIEEDGRPVGDPARIGHPIAGDDPAAKRIVAELLDEFGFDAVDAGPLEEGRRFEVDTPAYLAALDVDGMRAALAAV